MSEVSKREMLAKLILENDQVHGFVQSAIENQIDGNAWNGVDAYRNDIETAKNCGLSVMQLQLLKQLA